MRSSPDGSPLSRDAFRRRCTRPRAARWKGSSAADPMTDVKGPSAIPPPDRHQIERLNSLYQIIDQAPSQGGLKARIASGARRLLGRVLSRQQEFNAALVDHINRNTVLGFEAHHASVNTIE